MNDVMSMSDYLDPFEGTEIRSVLPDSLINELPPKFLLYAYNFVALKGEREAAAIAVGYQPGRAAKMFYRRMHHDRRVLRAIQIMVLKLFTSDAVAARETLVDLMKSSNTPPAVRRQAAMDVLSVARIQEGAEDRDNNPLSDRMDLSALSQEEQDTLERLLEKVYHKNESKVISGYTTVDNKSED